MNYPAANNGVSKTKTLNAPRDGELNSPNRLFRPSV